MIGNIDIGLFALLISLLLGLYLLPAIIARFLKSPRFETVLLVNIFAGWTMVGWIVALVLGSVQPRPRAVVMVQYPQGPPRGR